MPSEKRVGLSTGRYAPEEDFSRCPIVEGKAHDSAPTPKINSMKPCQNPRWEVLFANIDSQVVAEGIPVDYPMVKWRDQNRHPTLRSGGWAPTKMSQQSGGAGAL
jgi:hypothetical protein